MTIKAQILKFESKTPWSTARRPKKLKKQKNVIYKKENRKSQRKARKAAKPSKMARKS
jgi:hypothetical protein